ncbi:30S ribosomal protein S8 [Candidatus Woesearchaeota archaeon]|nr:30S ribosomal protein S8 [Candidatus Woesearchaeota archaeon]
MLNDPLAGILSKILNAEKTGKRECLYKPVSKLTVKVLDLLKGNGYIKECTTTTTTKGTSATVALSGNINKCGVVKPRFSVETKEIEKFEKRYLPAKGMGILIISTSKGLMSHNEAVQKNLGGRLIAYCY